MCYIIAKSLTLPFFKNIFCASENLNLFYFIILSQSLHSIYLKYILGGRDGLMTLNNVECFDPAVNRWQTLTPMLTHRHGLGVAVLNGPIYAVGGHDGWSYLNTVERYNLFFHGYFQIH